MADASETQDGPRQSVPYPELLADLLVWGVQTGWNLLGRPVNILLTESGLGYTHPASRGLPLEINVNPKVLKDEGGSHVLQGLILHELGHHFAHFSDKNYPRVFRLCKRDRLTHMLNVIEDEHLERRLRGLDPDWGERFDALASYAFKGKPIVVLIEKYARLLGRESIAEVTAGLCRGELPGRILSWEFGYELAGEIGRWVSGRELVDLVTEALTQAGPRGRLPVLAAEKMKTFRKEAGAEWLRTGPLGILDIMQDDDFFKQGGAGQEIQAKIHVSMLLETDSNPEDNPRVYLGRITRELRPLLADFPQLERYLRELEAVKDSRWFWKKQRAMLYMMRRNRDFKDAFVSAREMSEGRFQGLFGANLFSPRVILSGLLMTWSPRHAESREHPLKISVPWLDLLDCRTVADDYRFLISLRLGLGARGAGGRESVTNALKAVPRRLRKLDMLGLDQVTREVAACLGDCCLDNTPTEQSRGQDQDGNDQGEATQGAGDVMREILDRQTNDLQQPLGPEEEEAEEDDLRQAVEEAAERIREWLLKGVDPRKVGARESPALNRGAVSLGRELLDPLDGRMGELSLDGQLDHDMLNIASTLEFNVIHEIAIPPENRSLYRSFAASVQGAARAMRRFLVTLGRAEEESYGMRQGRRLDPGRVRRLATVNDPGVVVGYEEADHPDLFLGMCIDCSSSMCFEDRMDKAISFATLLMEATRNLQGVDTRALGFENEILWDAGTPRAPRVAGLMPRGGNNDAAGLLAMAKQAILSKRRHRLVVMISDGFPTGCSLGSLAQLVKVLEREYGIRSVQVAVARMEEERVVFPDFTDLSLHEMPVAVKLFGRMLQRVLLRQYS